jgi:hypothetical protein
MRPRSCGTASDRQRPDSTFRSRCGRGTNAYLAAARDLERAGACARSRRNTRDLPRAGVRATGKGVIHRAGWRPSVAPPRRCSRQRTWAALGVSFLRTYWRRRGASCSNTTSTWGAWAASAAPVATVQAQWAQAIVRRFGGPARGPPQRGRELGGGLLAEPSRSEHRPVGTDLSSCPQDRSSGRARVMSPVRCRDGRLAFVAQNVPTGGHRTYRVTVGAGDEPGNAG